MRGGVLAGAAALVLLAAAHLLARGGADEAVPPSAPRASPAPLERPTAAPAPAPAGLGAPLPDGPAAISPRPGGPTARDERLARSSGLGAARGETAALRLLRSYSADELALLARFEALTGTPGSPALEELIARRRAGASAAALGEAATRLFAGDPLGRAAALEWLRTTATQE